MRRPVVGRVRAKAAGPISYVLGIALVALGVLDLAGLATPDATHAGLEGGMRIGALLLCGIAMLLPRPGVVVAVGMVVAIGGLFGSVGFHVRHLVAGVAGPPHHGWHLLLTSSLAVLAVIATARRIEGLPRLGVLAIGVLAAVLGWMLAGTPSPLPAERRTRYEAPAASPPLLAPARIAPNPSALADPVRPAPPRGVLEVVVESADGYAIGTVADLLVLTDDGTILRREQVTIADGSIRHPLPIHQGTMEADVPSIDSATSVALSGDGVSMRLAPIRWSDDAGERRGLASFVLDGRAGIHLVGRVVTGSDRPVPGLDLIVASTPDRSLVGTVEDRLAGTRLRQTSVTVRTDAEGRFKVRNWVGGRHVYVRVSTPGWTRVSLESRERGVAVASGVDATPFEVPPDSPAGSTMPELLIAVGEILFVPVRVDLPTGGEATIGGVRNWLSVERTKGPTRPGVATQSMGWSSILPMPLPIPSEVTVLMSVVALDDTSHVDPMLERGIGIVRLPGCDPVEFPLRWQTLARLSPPRVQLRTRRPGSWTQVRFRLEGAPKELREVVEDGAASWVTVRDMGQPLIGGGFATWDRGLRLNRGTLEGLVLPEGQYQATLDVGSGVGAFIAASGADVEVSVPCRPLAGLGVTMEFPEDVRTSLWVVRALEGDDRAPVEARSTAIGTDMVSEVTVGIKTRTPRRRQFWFVEDDVPVTVSALRLGYIPAVASVRLNAGTMQEIVFR